MDECYVEQGEPAYYGSIPIEEEDGLEEGTIPLVASIEEAATMEANCLLEPLESDNSNKTIGFWNMYLLTYDYLCISSHF